MNPDAPFSQALDRFIDEGVPRAECGAAFLLEIAKFKFMPVVETTIEEKHSRVAISAGKHSIGPVQVSLANRLPLLERSLAQSPSSLTTLLDSLGHTRALSKIPALFDFEAHPSLKPFRTARGYTHGSGESKGDIMPTLVEIVYHCDIEGGYHSLSKQSKHHDRASARKAGEIRKLTAIEGTLGVQGVMRNAIRDHFKQTCAENLFYSLSDAAAPHLETFDDFMESDGIAAKASSAKRKRDDVALCAIEDDISVPGEPRTAPSHTPVICLEPD